MFIDKSVEAVRGTYSHLEYSLGELAIQAEETLGLAPSPEELREANADLLAYQNPQEAGRMPARIAVGMLASTATLAVSKIKGWV